MGVGRIMRGLGCVWGFRASCRCVCCAAGPSSLCARRFQRGFQSPHEVHLSAHLGRGVPWATIWLLHWIPERAAAVLREVSQLADGSTGLGSEDAVFRTAPGWSTLSYGRLPWLAGDAEESGVRVLQ